MIKKNFFLLILISASVFAQQAYNWKNYTDLKIVRDAINTEQGVWGASTGGAFFYDTSADTFLTYTKADGLRGSSYISIIADKNENIWLGGVNGIIDIYQKETNGFTSILDIFNNDRSNKGINQLLSIGDTVYAATDFGLSLIDINNLIFYDTFFKFGLIPTNTRVSSVTVEDKIYLTTGAGVAIQKEGFSNLSAPEAWNVYQMSEGLQSNSVNKGVYYQGNFIAGTVAGLASFNGSNFQSLITELNGRNIIDLVVKGDSLFILYDRRSGNTILSYEVALYTGTLTPLYSSITPVYKIKIIDEGFSVLTSNGILSFVEFTPIHLVPNSPQTNQFPEMTIDQEGVLWSASGRDLTGQGIYSLNNNIWTNINLGTNPQINTNAYFTAFTSFDNVKYFGSWGGGFLRFKEREYTSFNASNTPMTGTSRDPGFIVISGFANDTRNNLWVLNYETVQRTNLYMLTPDSSWHSFNIPSLGGGVAFGLFNLAIDQYNTKWFSGTGGVYYFNERETNNNSADDVSGFLSTSQGLNSNSINTIVVDKRGEIWIGTNLGVNIISNTNALLNQGSQIRISSIFSLRQQTINCIAVDPLNRKWVGTNQGLILTNPDGSIILEVYNSSNSALLGDEIRSIAIDEESGRVYAGTDNGLTSFDTPAIKPLESFNELFMYPNPYIINKSGASITIDGLIRDTDIKIISISGRLVREFSTVGGRVTSWDGRDESGEFVSSGVYIIVAYDRDGNNVITGKIAIIKE